jgi:lipoprotein-anchoring transpeptidase ErfK/SrfK
MGGVRGGGRLPACLAAAGIAAIGAGIFGPVAAGAASSGATAAREHARVLTAFLEPGVVGSLAASPLPADLQPRLDLQQIVAPIDGGDLTLFPGPGSTEPSQVLPAVNELGSPLVLLTVAAQGDWFEVLLPTRPNGSTAWVPASAVSVTAPLYRVEIGLSARELRVLSVADGSVVLTSPVGIGAPDSPTPEGHYFVRDHFPTEGAGHPYGPFAFGLSGHSDVHMQFGTGDGRLAIHGTNQPSSIGAAVSNGCPHVPNDVVLALIPYLPLGTPVDIYA